MTVRCTICGKMSSTLIQQKHFCNHHSRDFDRKDQQYRSAASPDKTIGKEGYTLRADYDQYNRAYTFDYRGHSITVKESDIIWETYPMNLLAEKATEFIKSIDKEIGWSWIPNKQKLSHNEILVQLEAVVKR